MMSAPGGGSSACTCARSATLRPTRKPNASRRPIRPTPKRYREGDRAIGQLRALNPGDPENTARAVVVLARNDRGREAARMADRWAADHPGHPAGTMLAVRAWTAAGQPDSAVARARRAVAADP